MGTSVRLLLVVSLVCVLQGLHACMHYWLHCGHASSHKRNHKLLVAVFKVPLSCGADLCSCLSSPSSAHLASVSLTCGPCCYLIWQHSFLIDHVTSLTGCLSLSVSPDCCYAFILEFLLCCLCLFFLSHTILLNLTWPSASSGTSSFWQCFEHVQWGHDVDSDNHMFCVHAHWVQSRQTDTRTD